jgi:DNA polymerase-3 subunit epsilon
VALASLIGPFPHAMWRSSGERLFHEHGFARVPWVQRSFDDLDTPLHDVTFCVVDLETTGGSANACAITEVGAARFRGGERLGTFQTLVNPGVPLAETVTALTGITEAMVLPAPTVSEVLPALLEFVGGSVLVGHNLRFDVSFLDAALTAGERSPVGSLAVDTVALARRLVRDEVPDCRLGTLAHHLQLDHRPTHRALDDALATADLLHVLIERAAAFGVTVLDDLLALPRLAGHPQAAKLELTNRLPRSPGVYILRDGQGRALHVGRASDLRRRVRSYFEVDGRPGGGPLLRAVQAVDHVGCGSSLEAAVREVRLAHALAPRLDHRFTRWRSYRYVKLTDERAPRLTVARSPRGDGARYLGPLPSAAAARAVIEAVESVVAHDGGAGGAHAGRGRVVHPGAVGTVARDLFDDPMLVLSPLHRHMVALHDAGRGAAAAVVGTMSAAVVDAVRRQRWFDALRRAGRVVFDLPDGGGAELCRGRLVRICGGRPGEVPADEPALGPVDLPPDDGPLPLGMADELSCVADWLDRHAHDLRLVHVEGELSSVLPALPSFHVAEHTGQAAAHAHTRWAAGEAGPCAGARGLRSRAC